MKVDGWSCLNYKCNTDVQRLEAGVEAAAAASFMSFRVKQMSIFFCKDVPNSLKLEGKHIL